MNELEQKVVVVTGGASGIGAAIAERFAAEGARVVVLDIEADVSSQGDRGSGAGPADLVLRCDVTDEGDVLRAVEAALRRYGRIDSLVNNVGSLFRGDCVSLAVSDWELGLKSNLTSAYLCSREVIPAMLAGGGGTIVNISSQGALVGVGNQAAYMAGKAGLIGLTRSITYDYAPLVRCNVLCPGSTRTRMIADAARASPDPGAYLGHIANRQFIGRMAEPDEIAGAALFLASPASSFIYGACFAADGGLTATSPRPH